MNVTQCLMARAALRWSQADLAASSGVGSRTVAKFELDEAVSAATVEKLRETFEQAGILFIGRGAYAGGVVVPVRGW